MATVPGTAPRTRSSNVLPLHPQPGGIGYRHWLGWVLGAATESNKALRRAREGGAAVAPRGAEALETTARGTTRRAAADGKEAGLSERRGGFREGERAAAALRRRDDLVAVRGEHPRCRRVDGSEHHGLHATCENANAPAGRARRRA